ncbi:HD domain-containing protein [Paraburkholderia panacisoli]|jgi:GTP pyrophosphokinase|uniref:HD domain-containing protein n=1 Tax=Paraburkholderia panacisoli TaxID=2603818 RepID=A0A5B0HLR6_9BURK|nr:HD domain-containing protein [Paraburkholderia panacisoli]KAA1015864.1 HD domain-containing protein [Paraburkholderia panacisoli]
MLTEKFARATALALQLHATQLRKGTQIPYTSHLLGVASLVLENGGDEEQAIAGLLHDAIEDVGPEVALTIREMFGDRVLRIVEGCTDGVPDASGQKPDWRTRKEAYLAHLERADAEVLLVSASDKLYNARAIVTDLHAIGRAVFDRFTAGQDGTLWYYGQLSRIFRERLPGPLSNEIKRTVDLMSTAAGD